MHPSRLLMACSVLAPFIACGPARANEAPRQPGLKSMVERYAAANGVPGSVGHAVVMLESRYRPHIVHAGNYGLMQIRYGTARAMGYRGTPGGLLNAETNLHFGMKYLARGWRSSSGDLCRTIAHYQTGRSVTRVPAASLAYCARARKIMASR